MKLREIMELRGGRGESTLGKKTPLYSGGNNPTVTHQTATHRAVLPLGQGGTTAESGTTVELHGTTTRAVLPSLVPRSSTGAVLPLLRAVLPLCAWLFGEVPVGLFAPLYKGVFFPKVDLPLSRKAPLLLQAPFSPDLSL